MSSIQHLLNPESDTTHYSLTTARATDHPPNHSYSNTVAYSPLSHSRSDSDQSAQSSAASGSRYTIMPSPSMSFRRPTNYPSHPAQNDSQHYQEPTSVPQCLRAESQPRTIYSEPHKSQNSFERQHYPNSGQIIQSSSYQLNERSSVRLAVSASSRYFSPSLQPSMPDYDNREAHTPSSNSNSSPPSPLRRKRSQDAMPPPAKKAKTTARPKSVKEREDGAPASTAKKAKKRTGAAGRAVQGDTMPKISYTQVMPDKGKGKALNTRSKLPDASVVYPEMQTTRCMSAKYKDLDVPRCVACTRRWAGDTCRFQNIRYLLRNSNNEYVGISFLDRHQEPPLHFPHRWNVPMQPEHLQRTKTTIARALLPALRLELAHQKHDDLIYRQRENDVRTTCDTCMTSIFSASWMCRLCGREACAECFEQVKRLTVVPPNATSADKAVIKSKKDKHAHGNPFFLSCTKRNDHSAEDFSPMSRFSPDLLASAIQDMEKLIAAKEKTDQDDATDLCRIIDEPTRTAQSNLPCNGVQAASSNPISRDICPADAPSLDIQRVEHSKLTDDIFRPAWVNGTPLVITGLLSQFKIQWTPEYFSAKYKKASCLILHCQTEQNKQSTVGAFFDMFAKHGERNEGDVWKLKDWPPSTDFKTEYPDLFADFSNAVPVPNYVRRDGVLNIASHFPANAVPPDIGPKMYNAMGSTTNPGSKGSTRLHMDMADALNIMTYAGPMKNGSPGCAAWDLFPAADSDKIRQYLRRHTAKKAREAVVSPQVVSADRTVENPGPAAIGTDPIHSQLFYVDEAMRKELFDDFGVKSWRIYQYPGEAVFIPAGCAHQVSNLADCIKVAVDFVSPENIERCEKLTREFREQNHSQVWKEDVLQLRSMMWYAWLSCEKQEKDQNYAGSV